MKIKKKTLINLAGIAALIAWAYIFDNVNFTRSYDLEGEIIALPGREENMESIPPNWRTYFKMNSQLGVKSLRVAHGIGGGPNFVVTPNDAALYDKFQVGQRIKINNLKLPIRYADSREGGPFFIYSVPSENITLQ